MSTDARPVPRATYRLQLHGGFRFDAAARLAPYLGRLGISHAYLSPIFRARTGSTHGYDIVDHGEINPELGGIEGFRAMTAAFRAAGIGIILDIVPNHMGIGGSDNRYWLDVLEHGATSRYARWFDIDWAPAQPSLKGKVLVPFLDRPLDEALATGSIQLRADAGDGSYAVWVHDHHKLPLARESYAEAARVLAGDGALANLLGQQHWRLAQASTGDDEINYRRFFIISDLAGIRIEDDEVFEHVHRLPFALIAEGLVDGLRIDHVDGLYDPAGYCRKLRLLAPRPIYIVVEKILGENESVPAEWGVDGTTGYEFAALVTPLLIDPAGETALTDFHRSFTGVTEDPAAIERRAKLRVMDHELAAEVAALSARLAALATAERPGGDLTRQALQRTLRAVIAEMPIYRLYPSEHGLSGAERERLGTVFAKARRRHRDLAPRAFEFLEAVMTGVAASDAARDLARRIQQFSGPVMAKGLEDTALYRHTRLIALNDVGERPAPFSRSIGAFHAANIERADTCLHSLLATSTHDSKRGEDTRCRIVALSGHASAWVKAVPEWIGMLADQGAPIIDPDDAYMVLQLLLGAWPLTPDENFADRVVTAMQKSLREARLRSSWIAPDIAYEGKVEGFIRAALDPASGNAMPRAFAGFAAGIGRDGALNGLIETVLKLTVPGVPDIYQGAELWEQSLVDPDNRRKVDFARRERLIDAVDRPLGELLQHWQDGAVKQALIVRLLRLRRQWPELFSAGSYEPIDSEDERVCAFMRRHGEAALLVAVQLYPGRGSVKLDVPMPAREWRDLLRDDAVEDELPVEVWGNFAGAK